MNMHGLTEHDYHEYVAHHLTDTSGGALTKKQRELFTTVLQGHFDAERPGSKKGLVTHDEVEELGQQLASIKDSSNRFKPEQIEHVKSLLTSKMRPTSI